MFTQLLHYVHDALKKGEEVPPFLAVIDTEKAALMKTSDVKEFLTDKKNDIKWGKSASQYTPDAWRKSPLISARILSRSKLPRTKTSSSAPSKPRFYRAICIRTPITPDNLKQVFDKWALRGVGVTLSPAEAVAMGEAARKRMLPAEALEAYLLLDADSEAFDRSAGVIEFVRTSADRDRDGDIERSLEAARQRNDVHIWVIVAQLFAGQGDHARAVEVYEVALRLDGASNDDADSRAAEAAQIYGRAIEFYRVEFAQHPCGWSGSAPRRFCPAQLALAQLNYGISLFKLGRVDDARATWTSITGSPAVEVLAQAWIDFTTSQRN